MYAAMTYIKFTLYQNLKKYLVCLTATGLIPGGSSTVHIYTKQYIEQHI